MWNALGSGMYAAVTFVLLFFVSRYCGPEAAGAFSIAFTTGQLLYLIGLFGVDAFHMTDYRKEYTLNAYGRVRLITCAVMLACCIPLSLFVYTGYKGRLTFVLTLYMMVNAAAELWQSEFFRQNRLELSGQALFFRNGLSILVFFITIRLGRDAVIASVWATVANLAATLCLGPFRWKKRLSEAQTSNKDCNGLLSACLPLFISTFLMTLLPNCAKYEMDILETDALVGCFSMIVIPLQVINLFSGFVFRPSLKNLSDALLVHDTKRFLQIFRKNVTLIALITAVCAALAAWLGVAVLGWLYHTDLSAYDRELVLVVVGGGLLAYSSYLFYILAVMRRQRFACVLYACATLLCAGLGYPLIVRMGMMGGVLSIFAAYLLLSVADTIGLFRMAGGNGHV